MLVSLGGFLFKTETLLHNKLTRNREQNISEHNRVGMRPVLQHLGPGRDEISLSGAIYPQSDLGTAESLEDLSDLADKGGHYRLIDEQGYIHGTWLIASINETRTAYNPSGVARKIEFSVKVRRSLW